MGQMADETAGPGAAADTGPARAGGVPRRVAALQLRPGGGTAAVPVERLVGAEVDLVVLPEYYWVRPADRDVREAATHAADDLAALSELSERLSAVLVGGTILETDAEGRLYNTAPVFHAGREVGRYRKRRLMPGEAAAGLATGADTGLFTAGNLRLGVLICADVFDSGSYRSLAPFGPGAIAVPTNSPFRPVDPLEDKMARDETYFAAGSREAGAVVVKACTVGGVFGRRAQGRSLVAGPDGLLVRLAPDQEDREALLIVDLPTGKLI